MSVTGVCAVEHGTVFTCVQFSLHRTYSTYRLTKSHTVRIKPMMPKARELALHGGPPGWLEESDPAGMILYVMYGPCRLP